MLEIGLEKYNISKSSCFNRCLRITNCSIAMIWRSSKSDKGIKQSLINREHSTPILRPTNSYFQTSLRMLRKAALEKRTKPRRWVENVLSSAVTTVLIYKARVRANFRRKLPLQVQVESTDGHCSEDHFTFAFPWPGMALQRQRKNWEALLSRTSLTDLPLRIGSFCSVCKPHHIKMITVVHDIENPDHDAAGKGAPAPTSSLHVKSHKLINLNSS